MRRGRSAVLTQCRAEDKNDHAHELAICAPLRWTKARSLARDSAGLLEPFSQPMQPMWAPVHEPAPCERLPRRWFTLLKDPRATGCVTGIAGKWQLTANKDADYVAVNSHRAVRQD